MLFRTGPSEDNSDQVCLLLWGIWTNGQSLISQDKNTRDQSGEMKESGEQTRAIIQQCNDCAQATQERRARGSGRRSRHMRDQSCCCRQYLRNLESIEPHKRPASVNERVIDKKYLRVAFMRFGQQLDGLKIWHKFYTRRQSPGKKRKCKYASEA